METEETLQTAPPPAVPRKSWIDRIQALIEVLLLAGLMSSILAALPFALRPNGREHLLGDVRMMAGYILLEAIITLLLLFLVLKAHGETLASLGIHWNQWRTNVLLGLATVLVLFVLNYIISLIFQFYLPRYYLERNPLTDLIRTPKDLLLFIGTALIAGGFKEEFQRAFILRRFQAYLGGAQVGLVLWSVVFGFGHYIQGAQGVVTAGLFGMIFGILYLMRGSLVAPIVAHGIYDTLALLGYWFLSSHK